MFRVCWLKINVKRSSRWKQKMFGWYSLADAREAAASHAMFGGSG